MENKRKKYNNLNNMNINFIRKPRIIYPIAKQKFTRSNSNYLKYLNNPLSNRFIYTKFLNKMKLKNLSCSSVNRENHSNFDSKININMEFIKQKNTNIKNFRYNYTNKQRNTFNNRIFTKIYKEDNKKESNNISSVTLKNENTIMHKNKKDNISYKEILKLWDKLFVTISYRTIFNELLSKLDEEDKNKLMLNEYNELNNLLNELDILLNSIKLRKELLFNLQRINKDLKLIFNAKDKEPNNFLVKTMSKYIEKMRKSTINICFAMKNIKNKVMNENLKEKYNINLISQNYNFDKNYLIKMKEEMKFLKEGNAKFFFKITEDKSPFLIKASEEDDNSKNDPFLRIVPMSDEIKLKIDKCNYIIYQELIAYQNKDLNNNIYRPISPPNSDKKDFPIDSDDIMTKNNKLKNNKNTCLEPMKKRIEKWIPKKELEIKFPSIKINGNYKNSLLKSNSCINFQISSKENEKETFFLTNLKKGNAKTNLLEISSNEIDNINESKIINY